MFEPTPKAVNKGVVDYYRCPCGFADFPLMAEPVDTDAFFRDRLAPGRRASIYDALADGAIDETAALELPFDPTEVAETLRRERYLTYSHNGLATPPQQHALWNAYRVLRPMLPLTVRKRLHRLYTRGWDRHAFPSWPVDTTVDRIFERLLVLALRGGGVQRIPFVWFWPEGAPGCAIVTHDVETLTGRDFCSALMDLDDAFGVKASFQIVPERRYPVTPRFLDELRVRGFEINVHDLDHDGQLFADRNQFLERAKRVNEYGRKFRAVGFRSGNLYRNQEWFDALEFSYDMSVPNVAHLDPQRGGCCTVMPYFVGDVLELPLTTTQDYSLFHILDDYSLDLWTQQLALVSERHGLASFIVHPDYVVDARARDTYRALLAHLAQLRADGALWIPLPREVDQWWRERSEMSVVADGAGWRIEGKGSERARLAFASLDGDRLLFTIEEPALL